MTRERVRFFSGAVLPKASQMVREQKGPVALDLVVVPRPSAGKAMVESVGYALVRLSASGRRVETPRATAPYDPVLADLIDEVVGAVLVLVRYRDNLAFAISRRIRPLPRATHPP